MSKVYLDLTARFSAAFGSSFGFAVKNTVGRVGLNPYQFDHFKESDVDKEFEDITLIYEDVTLNFASFPFVQAVKAPFHIPFSKTEDPDTSDIVAPPPSISFSRSKKLTETELNGEDAEVVERWNTQAWNIRIRGLLVDMKEHQYPSNLVQKIDKLFSHNDMVEVSGTQFFEKGISNIIIKDVDIDGVVGFKDTIQYSITARSARDVGFTLINPNE
ncbi:MAG: hypothetical protein JXR60_12260 [Bacteroidales bacterium]|nr:hypothetical protein [Bacteroidales bacterium]